MVEKTVIKPQCDFSSPTHDITGEVIFVSALEVSRYREAYGHFFLSLLPKEIQDNMNATDVALTLAFAWSMASGGTAVFPNLPWGEKGKRTDVIVSSDGDWACCEEHKKKWEEYKQKYPVEGN